VTREKRRREIIMKWRDKKSQRGERREETQRGENRRETRRERRREIIAEEK
jgi:hypothetical protein